MNPDDTLPPSSADDTLPPDLLGVASTLPAPPPTDPSYPPDIPSLPAFDLAAEELDEP